MKVVHIPFCYYPEPVGGTEIYVAGLAREQERQGHTAVICAAALDEANYIHDGIAVRRFALDPEIGDLANLYGAGDTRAAIRFGKILDQEKPDVVHLHAFTRGASLEHIQEAKRRGIPAVFSYHTPTVSCMRGTLLRDGTDVCDGVLDTTACASCNLSRYGIAGPFVNKLAGKLLGRLPSRTGRFIGTAGGSGRIATALRMTELVEYRHSTFRALMRDVDQVVALCNWTRDLLLRNGVPAGKVALSRQGVADDSVPIKGGRQRSSELRIAFLGRLALEKGVHVLIQALRGIPTAAITLDIFGVSQNGAGEPYGHHLSALAAGDRRISFHPPLLRGEVLPALRRFDLVAVPSQWMETGPMVVMEAFAAGVPVIGSRLGGIAELVEHNVNGLLVDPKSVCDWSTALLMLSENPDFANRLRAGIRTQRTMRDVAREMGEIYDRILTAVPAVSHG